MLSVPLGQVQQGNECNSFSIKCKLHPGPGTTAAHTTQTLKTSAEPTKVVLKNPE